MPTSQEPPTRRETSPESPPEEVGGEARGSARGKGRGLGRAITVLAAVSFVAGLGVGVLASQMWNYGESADLADPATAYVEKMAKRYSLGREQRRLVWMIYTQRIEEESRYTRSQLASLPNHARDQLETIAKRANQRILAVLETAQRTQFVADLAADNR